MSHDEAAERSAPALRGTEPAALRSSKVLSNRTIAICAAAVVLLAGVAGWLLLDRYGAGSPADQARMDTIRTVGTIVLGAGGAIALLLAARRQQTTEQDLVEKRRDLAHKERVQQHAEQVAANNYAYQLRVAEASEQDATERRITELYTKAAEQLGSDKAPVRLAGLYALERLAQDNVAQRPTIMKVICAYLRMPYTPPGAPPEPDAGREVVNDYRGLVQEREVRLTAQSIITAHLYPGTDAEPVDSYWGALELDLTGATLVNFGLNNCRVGVSRFMKVRFVGAAWFRETQFDRWCNFSEATFGEFSMFDDASMSAAEAVFHKAVFGGFVSFRRIQFLRAAFDEAKFCGETRFDEAGFDRAEFRNVQFNGDATFTRTQFSENTFFEGAKFGAQTDFGHAAFACDVPNEIAAWVTKSSADVRTTD